MATLTTRMFDYTVVVRTSRGEGRWEVLADRQSIACSTVWEPIEDALNGAQRGATDVALDAVVAGIAPWETW